MSMMDLFDDIGGMFDILDRLESWLTFATSPVSRRSKHGRLDLIQYTIPRADKMDERGLRPVNLRETMTYLKRFGVICPCNGFSSTEMWFQVRQNQKKWVDYLLNVDADGIPQLDYARKNWKESAAELKRQKAAEKRHQSRNWLDKIFG